jgi:hypothetical protein
VETGAWAPGGGRSSGGASLAPGGGRPRGGANERAWRWRLGIPNGGYRLGLGPVERWPIARSNGWMPPVSLPVPGSQPLQSSPLTAHGPRGWQLALGIGSLENRIWVHMSYAQHLYCCSHTRQRQLEHCELAGGCFTAHWLVAGGWLEHYALAGVWRLEHCALAGGKGNGWSIAALGGGAWT